MNNNRFEPDRGELSLSEYFLISRLVHPLHRSSPQQFKNASIKLKINSVGHLFNSSS